VNKAFFPPHTHTLSLSLVRGYIEFSALAGVGDKSPEALHHDYSHFFDEVCHGCERDVVEPPVVGDVCQGGKGVDGETDGVLSWMNC
jgi:hypothetical protein